MKMLRIACFPAALATVTAAAIFVMLVALEQSAALSVAFGSWVASFAGAMFTRTSEHVLSFFPRGRIGAWLDNVVAGLLLNHKEKQE